MPRKIKSFNYDDTFPRRFRELLDSREDITQEAIAELVGVTRQTVGNWYSGKSAPDAVSLAKIADEFDVSIDWLLRENAPKQIDATLASICRYTGLSEGAIQSLHVLQTNANAPLCNKEHSDFKASCWKNLVLVAKATQTILSRFIESGAAERFAEPLARHQIRAKELQNTVARSTVDNVLKMEDEEVGKLFREFGNEAIHQKTLEYEAREEVGRFVTKWTEEDDKKINDCLEGSAFSILKQLSMGSSISEMLANFNRLEQGE